MLNRKEVFLDKSYKHPTIRRYRYGEFICYVMACLNPNVYAKTGYYVTYDTQATDKRIYQKCFRTPKEGAIAFFNNEQNIKLYGKSWLM